LLKSSLFYGITNVFGEVCSFQKKKNYFMSISLHSAAELQRDGFQINGCWKFFI